VAVQVTVLTPPEGRAAGGTHPHWVTAQLSLAAAASQVTLVWRTGPRRPPPTMLVGQTTTGSSDANTVTVKVQLLVLPEASVAVQVTVLTPTGKVEPLGGTHPTWSTRSCRWPRRLPGDVGLGALARVGHHHDVSRQTHHRQLPDPTRHGEGATVGVARGIGAVQVTVLTPPGKTLADTPTLVTAQLSLAAPLPR